MLFNTRSFVFSKLNFLLHLYEDFVVQGLHHSKRDELFYPHQYTTNIPIINFSCQPKMESHERDAKGNSRKLLQDNKIRVERESEEFHDKTSTSDSPCFCDRKVVGVHCHLCKVFTPNVRLRKICPRHPKTVWLMDLQVCPKCFKGTNLQEFLQLRVEVRPKRSSTSSSSDSDL